MEIFKCKMCGGSLAIQPGESIAVCEYCGSKQTLPKLNDEKRANLYDRANYFRRSGEYDKAAGIFETILNEDKEDAEAYWSIVLCRYGIEYVEDPKTKKRVATINRVQYTPVQLDEDYQCALKYANNVQREVYEEEAKYIDELQKEFLKISEKEEPFDIFISYKESDELGNRTQDSVYAYDLYDKLTKEGYKVFFSRVTLENKLGSEYEPYIFAALNSAKVMLVVGTKKEYLNAVWVKNEWSRYLTLIKAGEKKVLIPVYRDMSAYDLPEELAYLQAQDMSKVGFDQDLIRGIKKIVSPEIQVKEKEASTTNVIIKTMLERAKDSLGSRDWEKAKTYFDNVLDYDPNNAEAYLGKLLVAYNSTSLEELAKSKTSIKTNENYAKLLQINNRELIESLDKCERIIQERIAEEKARKEKLKKKNAKIVIISISVVIILVVLSGFVQKNILPVYRYNKVIQLSEEKKYEEALTYVEENESIKNRDELLLKCKYNWAKNELENGTADTKEIFEILGEYKDSKQLYVEAEKKSLYGKGKECLESGEYIRAITFFESAKDFRDAEKQIVECIYQYCLEYKDNGKESDKMKEYLQLINSEDLLAAISKDHEKGIQEYVDKIREGKYQYCVKHKNLPDSLSKKYINYLVIVGYKDSVELEKEILGWHTSIYVKEDANGSDLQRAEITVNLMGGEKGESTPIILEVLLPTGENEYINDEKMYSAGDVVKKGIYNKTPDKKDIFSGNYTVKVYDGDDNLIGEYNGPAQR